MSQKIQTKWTILIILLVIINFLISRILATNIIPGPYITCFGEHAQLCLLLNTGYILSMVILILFIILNIIIIYPILYLIKLYGHKKLLKIEAIQKQK